MLDEQPGYASGWYTIVVRKSGGGYNLTLSYLGACRFYDSTMVGYSAFNIHDTTRAETISCSLSLEQLRDAKNHFDIVSADGGTTVLPEFLSYYVGAEFNYQDFAVRRRRLLSGQTEMPFVVPVTGRHFCRPHPYRESYLCNGDGYQFECTESFTCLQRKQSDLRGIAQDYILETVVRDDEYWYCILDDNLYQVRTARDTEPELLAKLRFHTHPSSLFVVAGTLYIVPSSERVLYRLESDYFVPVCPFPRCAFGFFQRSGVCYCQL